MNATPGPWKWDTDGWAAADASGSVYHSDGENEAIEKYMGLRLCGPDGVPVIPLCIDHYKVEYDGDPITPANRALIAAAPTLIMVLRDTADELPCASRPRSQAGTVNDCDCWACDRVQIIQHAIASVEVAS